MDVRGLTDDRCYRVHVTVDGRHLVGLMPETVMAEDMGLPPRPPHGAVYAWLARHRPQIEQTLTALAEGRGPGRRPFDALILVEETKDAH